ncbi:MAG: putative hydrolase of the alpha/beta-hydrolase fold protein [Myxococcaceae bacterium]|nr:putative hydrolase of the alpha/beta-hydrolase fold protein [Myxococcaceae bacterium]
MAKLATKKAAAKRPAKARTKKAKAAVEKVDVGQDVEVTLRRYGSEGSPLLVLAHGAGGDQNHPWMVAWARALGELGLHIVTFDFPYTARGKRAPDKSDVLERCWVRVLAHVRAASGAAPIFAGGKSMGGRIASQIVAGGENVRGLVFLGYPLHPPGKPADLRTQHWPKVRVPSLFVQGTRDPFGNPMELAAHIRELGARATVYAVDGGDHSLVVPKKGGVPQATVDAAARRAIVDFVTSPNG